MAELISVIIPAYNAEKFIERCLSSVLGQSYRALEVIVVDDGSGDNTAAEVNRFVDERLSLLRLPSNCGQSVARNTGLAVAKGEYIGFVDADDFIDNDFYERLISEAKRSNADIVMGETRCFSKNKGKIAKNKSREVFETVEKIALLKHGGPCDKLYKRDFICKYNIKFPEGLILEDNFFVVQAFYLAQKVVAINGAIYNYVCNPASTMRSIENKQKRLDCGLTIATMILKFLVEKKAEKKIQRKIEEFILDNIINKKELTNDVYYRKVSALLGGMRKLKILRFRLLFRRYFRFSARQRCCRLFGRELWKRESRIW